MFLNKHPYTRYRRIHTRWKNKISNKLKNQEPNGIKASVIRIYEALTHTLVLILEVWEGA